MIPPLKEIYLSSFMIIRSNYHLIGVLKWTRTTIKGLGRPRSIQLNYEDKCRKMFLYSLLPHENHTDPPPFCQKLLHPPQESQNID